jgi:alkaline phosphatase D
VIDRRRALKALVAVGGAALPVPRLARAAEESLADDPFALGVASGFPTDQSVVLWTRLAPRPLQPMGSLPPVSFPVRWELAVEEAMTRVIARGTTRADAAWSHSAHVEVHGLMPAREYWYRFFAAGHASPVGRTRTMPAVADAVAQLDMATVCCQNYEQGHYAAYGHIVADAPDLVLHLGDYIYEYGINPTAVRQHNSPEIQTLADYRARYALYKSDPQLQAAHAAAPWLVTWDDHEVENDYAGLTSLDEDEDPALFLARRTAAYRAYFENMPLPPAAAPHGTKMRIYTRRSYGGLAAFHILDQRQFRSPKACMKDYEADAPPELLNCESIYASGRTMLGAAQERWLETQLATAQTRWNFIVQGTMVANVDERAGPGRRYSNDNWSSYRAARDRLVDALRRTRATNPVVLTGDVHAFVVGHVTQWADQPDSPVVAPEFVTTGVSSSSRPQRLMDQWMHKNPNLVLCAGETRGYLRLRLKPEQLEADLIAIDDARDPASGRRILRRYVVESGHPAILG